MVLLLLAAAVAGWYVFRHSADNGDGAIRISGNIEATDVECSFKVAGWVESRLVSEGETVQAGQPVAQLDSEELAQEAAMRRAELAGASAKLAELEAGSRTEEVERSRASVEQAQARLDELLAGSRSQEIEAARASVQRAGAEMTRAETDYSRLNQLYERNAVSAKVGPCVCGVCYVAGAACQRERLAPRVAPGTTSAAACRKPGRA